MNSLPSNLQEQLKVHEQLHVLRFWDELDEGCREQLVEQLSSIDFDQLAQLVEQLQNKSKKSPYEFAPIKTNKRCDNESLCELGESLIRNGELGVLTVAGGQGTRLGWSGPKGTYPATPVTGKPLFQIIAEQILYASEKYGVTIPWYLMTSIDNDEATRSFLLDNNCFGLERTNIIAFTQGQVPAIDENGKMLLASKSSIAMNPDGHGGVIAALESSGTLGEIQERGVKYLSYIQVDNPFARVVDPVFLGMHVDGESSKEASSKCVAKTEPDERVGVFCKVDDATSVVEYSDLTQSQSQLRNDDGSLMFGAGSIAIHLFSTEFLSRSGSDLPWHIAHKIIPHINQSGELIEPTTPNAFKFEKFVFDVLQLASNSIVVETNREDEFAPIKNQNGPDSPTTSHALQFARARRWLLLRGIEVPESAKVELSPLLGASPEELDVEELPCTIEPDEILAL